MVVVPRVEVLVTVSVVAMAEEMLVVARRVVPVAVRLEVVRVLAERLVVEALVRLL